MRGVRYSLAVKAITGEPLNAGASTPNPSMQRNASVPLDEGRAWSGDLYDEGVVSDPSQAFGSFSTGDDAEAWLDKNEDGSLTGWVRDGADVYRYSDPEAWALDVDGAGMQLQHSQATGEGVEADPAAAGDPLEPDPEAEADAALNPDPEAEAAEAEVADQHIGEDAPDAFADEEDPATEEGDPTEVLEDPTDLPGDTEGEFDNPFAELTDDEDAETETDGEPPADDEDPDAPETVTATDDEPVDDEPTDEEADPDEVEPDGDADDEDPDDDEDDEEEDEDDNPFKTSKKHMPGKHNQESHGDWSEGIAKGPKRISDTSKGGGRPKGGEPAKAPKKAALNEDTIKRLSDEDLDAIMEADEFYDEATVLAAAKEFDSRRPLDNIVRSDASHTEPGSPERAAVFDSVIPDEWATWAGQGFKKQGARPGRRSKRDEVRDAYDQHIAAQMQAAADHLRGGSAVSKEGRAKGITEEMMFNGQATRAQVRKYGSEELLKFFAENPRMTFSEFAAEFYPSYAKAKSKVGSRYLSEHG